MPHIHVTEVIGVMDLPSILSGQNDLEINR